MPIRVLTEFSVEETAVGNRGYFVLTIGQHSEIDSEKLIAAAIELGRHPATDWSADGEAVIVPHPIQAPRQ